MGAASAACAQPAGLFFDRTSLSFDSVMGEAPPAPQTINFTSSGFQTFIVSNIFNTPWLMATPVSGATPATLQISVDPTGLSPGIYDAQLQVLAGSGASPPPLKIRLTVEQAPKLIALPASLSFTYPAGQPAAPVSQFLYVTASGKPVSVSAAVSGGDWLAVTPAATGTPVNLMVTANPASLAPNSYNAAITISSPEAPPLTVPVSLTVTSPFAAPSFQASGITNLATTLAGAVAPGEMLSIRGANLGGPENFIGQPDASRRLPVTLGETQVFFDGIPAALLLVAPATLTLFAPYEIAGRNTTQVTVVHAGVSSKPVTAAVSVSSPGIYTWSAFGQGQAIALNHDLSLNSDANPAAPGSIIVLYMTGEGQTNPVGVDGLIASTPLPTPVLPVSVLIDGRQADVLYAGGVPTLAAGFVQVNAVIPAAVALGDIPVEVTVGPNTSRGGVTIAVR